MGKEEMMKKMKRKVKEIITSKGEKEKHSSNITMLL